MRDQLSSAQRQIVEFPLNRGHMLVLAAPGSGKTRAVTERIADILARRAIEPEHLLVMTFTIRAAAELRERLERRPDMHLEGCWVGTFHSICDRLLREHGAAIGLDPSYVIYDTPRQRALLRGAAERTGWCLDDERDLRKLQDRISARKQLGLRPEEQPFTGSRDPDHLLAIHEQYQQLLDTTLALDYDDLILKCIQLLREDVDTASKVRNRFRYVFVDEYHDVSPEQYALIVEIAPARSRAHAVMVVADPNQSIYGWRQADAPRMIERFRRDYRPTVFDLEENYRSAGQIVRAAHNLIIAGGAQSSTSARRQDQHPIDCRRCSDATEEAEWVAKQIARARASGAFGYDDIAVLYRTHQRADQLETTLLSHNIPLVRVQQNRFYDDPDIQAILRYLALVAAMRDENFEPALNWPRVLVDELTMIHLRRLADNAGMRLSELAQRIDTFHAEVSPLTRRLIRDFCDTIATDLLRVADQPIAVIVERLLALLARRRSPFPNEERDALRGFLEFLGAPLHQPVALLREALASRRTIVLRHDNSIDALAGAVILEHTLVHYLQHTPLLVGPNDPTPSEAFVITFGSRAPASTDGFGLDVRDAMTIRFSISTQAWRLGQMLLMSFETLRDGHFVVYDFETSDRQRNTAEILEIAAVRLDNGKVVEPSFHSMVRPRGNISADATRVHGIRWQDVSTAPPPVDVLPGFFDYIKNTTLVGHNIAEFDHRILTRVATAESLPRPTNPLVDTCDLARRLLPGTSHSLADLARRFGITEAQTHRALDDAHMTTRVFQSLLDLHAADKELDVMNEALPLVSIGIYAAGLPLDGENGVLAHAGRRAKAVQMGATLQERLVELGGTPALSVLGDMRTAPSLPPSEDDRQWQTLVDRWQAMLGHYRRTQPDQSLTAFLHHAALAAPIDHLADGEGRVTLMTIHNAKGMEWPFVFIIGGEEGCLPFWASEKEGRLDEERRVLYVGMTRAMHRLCITWIHQDGAWQRQPSRFLRDIPDDLIRRYGWTA